MEKRNQIKLLFAGRIRYAFDLAEPDDSTLQEIRLRVGQPIIFRFGKKELFLEENGKLSENCDNAIRPSRRELESVVEAACGYSGYAFEEELKKGYVTIQGGHRIGLAGQAVVTGGRIQSMKHITALNIRLAREVRGCAAYWEKYFYEGNRPCHMLIISPPAGGKTTLLREIIRLYSKGTGDCPPVSVSVADERSEIGGSFRGELSFDLGMRTDVMDGCPKEAGMEMLLRSMAPDVIAADEIGAGDLEAIERAVRTGCRVIATLHGEALEDFLERPSFLSVVKGRVFERYLILKGKDNPGRIARIYDKNFRLIWEEKQCI